MSARAELILLRADEYRTAQMPFTAQATEEPPEGASDALDDALIRLQFACLAPDVES